MVRAGVGDGSGAAAAAVAAAGDDTPAGDAPMAALAPPRVIHASVLRGALECEKARCCGTAGLRPDDAIPEIPPTLKGCRVARV